MRFFVVRHTLYVFAIIIALLWNSVVLGQKSDTWIAFYNQDSTKIGYKDSEGNMKIAPRFSGYATAMKFEDIISVISDEDGKWTSYYLNKAGQTFGTDSLYFFDNAPDCEHEGFIRFRDHRTDKVGVFNKLGNIVIPAIYDDLTKVRNGMLVGLKGAEKKYEHEQPYEGDNYYTWVGGQEVLIDTLNTILVENFPNDRGLDFYSLGKSSQPATDKRRKSFRTKEGTYFSFIDFETEFRTWLQKDFLPDLTMEKLMAAAHDTIVWESTNGWTNTDKQTFIQDHFAVLKKILTELQVPAADYSIIVGHLNPFMYTGEDFALYFNNCRESKEWQYPVLNIVITYNGKGLEFKQNHFDFLRTDEGYKLISVTIRNAL